MLRLLTFVTLAFFAVSTAGCMSPCRKSQRMNAKLIAGKHDFGKKTKKWKRKQHY